MRFFKQYFEDELEMQFAGIYGNAVAFLNYKIDSPLTVDSPLELTIDMEDMSNLQKRVVEIFRYFRGHRKGTTSFLAPEMQKKFINLVNKRIALSISAGALIEDKKRELIEINNIQDTVIDLLAHYPRAFIVGGAGTGKTWIGIKKIKKSLQEGAKALYLCYNKALADNVRKMFDGKVDCYNFDSLMFNTLKAKALDAPEKNGSKEYAGLLEKIECPKYDLVVVDEGQDFSEDWAYCVNLFTKTDGELYVLFDESQNIFQRDFADKFYIENPPFVLRYNIRNTANIYRYAKEQTNLGKDTLTNQIEGVDPEQKSFTRKSQLISFIDSIINKLVNREGVAKDKIIILSDRKKEKSVLKDVDMVGGCKLNDIYDDDNEVIKYRTVQGFKGLEADVVIFVNHTYKNEPQTDRKRAILYTALTRARFFLYCLDYEENIELRVE
jgi:superfamily I DNA and RNA helicase